MSDIGLLQDVGLPGWVIIIAAIIFVFDRVGLFRFFWNQVNDRREFEQEQAEASSAAKQSEQVALWSQMTRLQTMALHQNELLLEYIINSSSEWHVKHSDRLNEVAERQQSIIHEIRQLSTKFQIMVGIIEANYGQQKTPDDG